MPLQNYSSSWTPAQFESDLAIATAQATGDIAKVPGILNNMGWSVNNFDVRDYVSSHHPDLYAAWQSKYGSFFKTDPMVIGAVIILLLGGFYIFNKSYEKKEAQQ